MSTIEEKRVYGERGGDTAVYLATDAGVVRVAVAVDRIGGFGLERRCVARDIGIVDGTLAVATAEDVVYGDEPTGFGPAIAVGGVDAPIAAGPDGRIARHDDGWNALGRADNVRAIDGDLVATAQGVLRTGSSLQHVGLDGVNDVSTPGVPLAATDAGLYRLGNGWMKDEEGSFELVAADRESDPGGIDRACAVADDRLFVHEADADGDGDGWAAVDVPAEPAAIAIADALYVATGDGKLFVDAGDGWRSQVLGIQGVTAMVVA